MATLEEKLSKLEEYVKQQKSWKQEFEELKRAYEGLKIERDNLAKIVEQGSKGEEDLLNEMKHLKNRNKLLDAKDKAMTRRFKEVEKDLKLYDELRSVFRRMFPKGVPPGFEPGTAPQGRGVSMAEVDERINQRLSGAKEIRVVEVDVDKRLKQLVKDTIIDNIISKVKALPGPARKAAPWLCQRKEASVGELNEFLYEKSGRPSGAFYNNTVIPLEEAQLITRNQGQITWTLRNNLTTKLGDAVSEEDLEKTRKYILSFLL